MTDEFRKALTRVVVAWDVWRRSHDPDDPDLRCCGRTDYLLESLEKLAEQARARPGDVVDVLSEIQRRQKEGGRPLVPVRWQVVEGGSPSRTPVHRTVPGSGLTRCGEEIPAGAWGGDMVERPIRKKCAECWGE